MHTALARTLSGERVVLEPLAERHESGLRAAGADERISTWLPGRLHVAADFDRWFADALAALAAGRAVPFATVDRERGVVLGSTSFLELRPEHRCVEIGATWLEPAAWSTGANAEAKLLMLGCAFEQAGCIRVELKTDARNVRSRRAMEALPAQFEGIHRQHRVLADGSLRDSAWYSVLDREWPGVRERLRERLRGGG